jgi:hemolysin III
MIYDHFLAIDFPAKSKYSLVVMYQGEKFNTISHLVGSLFALAGLVLLVVMSSLQGDPWKIVSLSIYGTSLLLVYLNSTFYHAFSGKTKKVFRTLDHLSIYLLIAGTYTPLTLVTLRGGWGWSLFGAIWGLAILGIGLELLLKKRHKVLAILIYVIMGWLVVVAIQPLWKALSPMGVISLVTGGLLYTCGVYFYVSKEKINHSHGIWHLFVLAGSVSHFATMFFYVL